MNYHPSATLDAFEAEGRLAAQAEKLATAAEHCAAAAARLAHAEPGPQTTHAAFDLQFAQMTLGQVRDEHARLLAAYQAALTHGRPL